MSRGDVIVTLVLCGALFAIMLVLGVLVPSVEEDWRQERARGQRACAMRLAVSRNATDSLTVLSSTNWKGGCAYVLTGDTMPVGTR